MSTILAPEDRYTAPSTDPRVQVPPPPFEVPAPGSPSKPKRPAGLIAGLIAGGLAIALISALATSLAHKTPTGSNPNVAPPVNVPLVSNPGIGADAAACIDTTASSRDALAVENDMNSASQAANNLDVAGAAQATHQAAADAQLVAADVAADPAISAPVQAAATDFASAGDALDAGDIAGATASILAANAEINIATAALGQTTVPAC
jgi:hypothetical protein